MPITDVIRARRDHAAKERAAAALADMGLPISDAIRLLMLGAGERRLPPGGRAPGPATESALAEREAGQDRVFAEFQDLIASLRDPDD